uniref:Uncharacterized protein n=1 Tax=Clastoptera arizonana TaxID=38151 RepID=A0A1B6DGE5_9HEMI
MEDPYSLKKARNHKRKSNLSWKSKAKNKAVGYQTQKLKTGVKAQQELSHKSDLSEDVEEDDRTESSSEEEKHETVDKSSLKNETKEKEKPNAKNYSCRKVTSNWEKYNILDAITKDEEDGSKVTDYGFLLNLPKSYDGRLKLKEVEWSAESRELLNSCLSIDLNLISKGLACIPFFERQDLSEDLFTVSFINLLQMNTNLVQNFVILIWKFKTDVPSGTSINYSRISIKSRKLR